MPHIVREELWRHPGHPGMIVVTTNATVTNGKLVMGCGAALQAKQRIPGIEYECAEVIREATRSVWSYPAPRGEMAMDAYDMECMMEDDSGYYFQVVRRPGKGKVGFGIFQVKVHFRGPADLELIERSAITLGDYAWRNPDTAIRMNMPGVGYGLRTKEEVLPLLDALPQNVMACYK